MSEFKQLINITEKELIDKYPFIENAHISEAVIEKESSKVVGIKDRIVWHEGILSTNAQIKGWNWMNGRLYNADFSGTWRNGKAESVIFHGTWFNGIANNCNFDYADWRNGSARDCRFTSCRWYSGKYESIIDDEKEGFINSVWHDGTFVDGYFIDSTWKDGKWGSGIFKRSIWENGVWDYGDFVDSEWNKGTFKTGKFYLSKWHDGTFENGFFSNSYFLNGTFKDGLFNEDSHWINGKFVNGRWLSSDPKPKRIKYFLNPVDKKEIKNKIGRINNPSLYELSHELSKLGYSYDQFIDIKDIKKVTKSNFKLAQLLSKKDGQELLKNKSNGFSIKDIEKFDKEQSVKLKNVVTNNINLVKQSNVVIDHATWGYTQTHFDEQNKVFQVNFNKISTDKILEQSANRKVKVHGRSTGNTMQYLLVNYIEHPSHPTSKELLTLSWIRYTELKNHEDSMITKSRSFEDILINGIVIDEIQSDLPQLFNKDEEMMNLIKGWEEFTMKLFIKFARNTLHYKKIYMPTYQSKLDLYDSNPPQYLYKELPNRFGFRKDSDLDGFMILENKHLKLKNLL